MHSEYNVLSVFPPHLYVRPLACPLQYIVQSISLKLCMLASTILIHISTMILRCAFLRLDIHMNFIFVVSKETTKNMDSQEEVSLSLKL